MAHFVADDQGKISGIFHIPANVSAGSKTVSFIGKGGSKGVTAFVGQGKLTSTILRSVTNITYQRYRYDPLAQTFTLEKNTQLAGVDLWFTAKDTEVRIEIREVQNGVPNSTVLAQQAIAPENIVASGGGYTRILFDVPVLLSAWTEYALVVLCNDPNTKLAVAEMGKYDVNAQQWVTAQAYTSGVLLSSSNASSWTAHQDMDLTFRLLEAEFSENAKEIDLGTVAMQNATDLMLLSVSDIPSAQCRVEYEMTITDSSKPEGRNTSVQSVADGQVVLLAEPTSGQVSVKAKLTGDRANSPILFPGTQFLSGTVGETANYVSRSISAKDAAKAVLVYDAFIPSSKAGVTPKIKIDSGDWENMDQTEARKIDDGFVEFRYEKALDAGTNMIKAEFLLSGTPTARPIVRDIRLMTSM